MGAIFLSYAREDRSCAEKLAHVLGAAGHDVWWDRRLDGGEEFSAEIEAALEQIRCRAGCMVAESGQVAMGSRRSKRRRDRGKSFRSASMVHCRRWASASFTRSTWRVGRRRNATNARPNCFVRSSGGCRGREEPAPATPVQKPKRRFPLPRDKLLWAAAVLVLVVAVAAALMFQNARDASGRPLKPTIALLPFTTASPDPELRAVASQARDFNRPHFSQSGVPLRLLNAAPQDGSPKVDFQISGDVSRNGDKVLATVRLDETAHGLTVYSHQFEAGREDLRDLPERIGAQMAGNLTWSAPMMILDRRRPSIRLYWLISSGTISPAATRCRHIKTRSERPPRRRISRSPSWG